MGELMKRESLCQMKFQSKFPRQIQMHKADSSPKLSSVSSHRKRDFLEFAWVARA